METTSGHGHREGPVWSGDGVPTSRRGLRGLLLLATSAGDADTLAKVGQAASTKGYNNISFISNFLLGRLEDCLEILITSGRLPEAAFFARTYLPSQISR